MQLWTTVFLILFFITQTHAFPQTLRAQRSSSLGPNTCLQCHGGIAPVIAPHTGDKDPPLLSSQFSMEWDMYEFQSSESPPFADIPSSNKRNHGQTFYDWSNRQMVEIYFDHCIDIFPSGNEFSCKFISNHAHTYLVRYELGDLSRPQSCCQWSKQEFWAPRPDVLKNFSAQKSTRVQGSIVDWWLVDVPLPGPFGYGTSRDKAAPVAFWFPVIGGWVQQNFLNYSDKKPAPDVFKLPALCSEPVNECDLQ